LDNEVVREISTLTRGGDPSPPFVGSRVAGEG